MLPFSLFPTMKTFTTVEFFYTKAYFPLQTISNFLYKKLISENSYDMIGEIFCVRAVYADIKNIMS